MRADRIFERARREKRYFLTTDYVLDETVTLLKARDNSHLCEPLFARALESTVCRIVWTDVERFLHVREFFLKHIDQAWSFTDCLSFCLMRELHLRDALTTDHHFMQAGFNALLR
jgi:hypothetical protein